MTWPRCTPPDETELDDTGLDVIASLTTLVGVRIAAAPADHDHRFGHGKAEALVALAQVALISVSAVGIGWRSIDRLINGSETAGLEIGIGVSLFAIAATLVLLWYQRIVIARTSSVAIKTDNVHYQSDLFLNGSVIVALVLDQTFHIRGADAVFVHLDAVDEIGHALGRAPSTSLPSRSRTGGSGACSQPSQIRHSPTQQAR